MGTSFTSLVEDVDNIMGKYTSNLIMNDQDIAMGLMDNYLGGLGSKMRNFYRYGEDGRYIRGLPEGTLNYTTPNYTATKEAIESEVGQTVYLQTAVVEKCDTDFMVYKYLIENHGFDPDTLEVANPPYVAPSTVYYVDHKVINSTTIEIEYKHWIDGRWGEDGDWHSEYVNAPIANSPNSLYVNAVYVMDGEEYYWIYKVGTGTYPDLDVTKNYSLTSKYYPIVPVKEKNLYVDEISTELYESSKKALNRLDIDIDELITGVAENPDEGDVDHAYFIIGANLQSEHDITKEYLYRYFKYLSEQSLYTKTHYTRWLANPVGNPPMNEVVISDGELDITLNYLYTDVETVNKVIGPEGTVLTSSNILPRAGQYKSYYETSEFTIEYQVNSTQCDVVMVKGLLHRNNVYKNHMVETNLQESLSEDENNFIIPLNFDVVQSMGIVKATELSQDTLLMVFQSYKTVKLKWYQTGFFKFVAAVIAVVVMYYTGIDLYTTIVAAGSYTAAALVVAEYVIKVILASIVFKFVVETLGVEIALILVAVMAAYGMYNQFTATPSVDGLPFAEELLSASNGMSNAIGEHVADQISDIQSELIELQDEYTSFQDELDKINEDLMGKDVLNPYLFIQPAETTDVYLARTIHSGNIGVLSLDAIENYCDIKLDVNNI